MKKLHITIITVSLILCAVLVSAWGGKHHFEKDGACPFSEKPAWENTQKHECPMKSEMMKEGCPMKKEGGCMHKQQDKKHEGCPMKQQGSCPHGCNSEEKTSFVRTIFSDNMQGHDAYGMNGEPKACGCNKK